ncbi:MAG TPA: HAMP domain-containing sensor histidine kinase, partial [Cyclobacteriaceae bacterium]|nr:HAMP domain-containing sensor histidine kinase [Cyclobacteriaceae bacterium]
MSSSKHQITQQLPWWTWVLPVLILHAGSQLSLLFKYDQGIAFTYLPTAFAVVMINWWGAKRVLPAMYINASLSTYFWGIEEPLRWFIISIPETLFVLISWLLFTKLVKGKFWLPDIKQLIYFILLGLVVPILIEISLLEFVMISFFGPLRDSFLSVLTVNFLGEFTSCFGFCIPLLYYGSPILKKKGLLLQRANEIEFEWAKVPAQNILMLISVFALLLALTFIIDFNRFWFVYAIMPLAISMRYGFGFAILTNAYIYLVTYVAPTLMQSLRGEGLVVDESIVYIFLGTSMLYLSSALTGRLISDLKRTEILLKRNNQELEQTNKELDRFVYSASHDLSAPLKSILGLINVSKLDVDGKNASVYLSEIEKSIHKLDAFIGEILDYSKNKRLDIVPEQIKLKELCQEIIDNLKYDELAKNIEIELEGLNEANLFQDKTRLKIILNNLISNAIKFQKKIPEHKAYIKI